MDLLSILKTKPGKTRCKRKRTVLNTKTKIRHEKARVDNERMINKQIAVTNWDNWCKGKPMRAKTRSERPQE